MKSFINFINESNQDENWERTEEDYARTIDMIFDPDPYTSHYGLQDLEVLYEDEDKRIISQMIVNKLVKDNDINKNNYVNPYNILIILEKFGLEKSINFDGGPFQDQFEIKTLTQKKFKNILESRDLEITITKITKITPNFFKGLINIERIYLNGHVYDQKGHKTSRLDSISPDLFKDCKSLFSLHMSGFEIGTIEEKAFVNNKDLRAVIINGGTINKIDKNAFVSNSITEINLYNNLIENLEEETFLNCYNLNELNLTQNRINKLPSNIFSTSIEQLYIDHNRLTEIPVNIFKGLKSLSSLDISNNPIEIIKRGTFSGLESLSQLSCSNIGPVKQIEKGAFLDLKNLSSIDLIRAKIGDELMSQIRSELPTSIDFLDKLPF